MVKSPALTNKKGLDCTLCMDMYLIDYILRYECVLSAVLPTIYSFAGL
jgi:hypothetical protein